MKTIGQKLVHTYLLQGLLQDKLSPSLFFIGPNGVGKKTLAMELAKSFACRNAAPSSSKADFPRCDECPACIRIHENNHSDFLIIDRQSQAVILKEKAETQTAVKIESVRYLDKFLRLLPIESRRRFVIIDEANKMTNEAANALLKILEEPPPNAQIVLLAPEERSVPLTIASRCAVLRFRPIPTGDISKWLQQVHKLNELESDSIAAQANGSFEKALSLLENKEDSIDISDYSLDEFFELVGNTNWRREGRKQAELALQRILTHVHKKWTAGDLSQLSRLQAILAARRQIDRNVSPRLVLENLYLQMFPQ